MKYSVNESRRKASARNNWRQIGHVWLDEANLIHAYYRRDDILYRSYVSNHVAKQKADINEAITLGGTAIVLHGVGKPLMYSALPDRGYEPKLIDWGWGEQLAFDRDAGVVWEPKTE